MAIGDLFLGLTVSPAREYIAEIIKRMKADRVYMPCVGRFSALAAAIKGGCPPDRIYASDISLFSSLIGYLADPEKSVYDLGIELPATEPYAAFLTAPADETELVAGLLLCMYYAGNSPAKNAYLASALREVRTNWQSYRSGLASQLNQMLETIRGIHYDILDMRAVLDEFRATGTTHDFLFVAPPFYAGGYTKMFAAAEALMPWNSPHIAEFDPSEATSLFEPFTDHPGVFFLLTRFVADVPEGWLSVFANAVTGDRIDYIFCNRPVDFEYVSAKIPDAKVRHYEVYADQEITDASVLSVLEVNAHTGLYYRDLFVHRLGTTNAEAHFLLLVDDRVITAFGIHTGLLMGGKIPDIVEVYGTTRTSARYRRLSKLFELAISARDFRDRLLASKHFYFLRLYNPQGIRTTALTTNPNAGLYRGVMKEVSKQRLKDGTFKIVHRADFRDETWDQTIKVWLKKHGGK